MNIQFPYGPKITSANKPPEDALETKTLPNAIELIQESAIGSGRPLSTKLQAEPPAPEKVQTYTQRFFGFIGKGVVKLTESSLFSWKEIEKVRIESLAELNKMTPGEELGSFLSQISLVLTETIHSSAFNEGILKRCIEGEGEFLQHLIQSLSAKMACNFGRKLQAKNGGAAFTSLQLAAFVAESLKMELDKLREEIKQADAREDPYHRESAIAAAEVRAVDSWLALVFPNGSDELPLRLGVRTAMWSFLKNSVLPGIVSDIGRLYIDMQGLSKIEELKKDPEKAILVDIAENAGYLAQRQSHLLADPQVAKSLAVRLLSKLPPQMAQEHNELLLWLTSVFITIGKNDDPLVSIFWQRAGFSVETLASHILYSLSHDCPQGDDPVIYSVMQLSKQVSEFFKLYGEEIQNTANTIHSEGKIPERDPRLIECFRPLAAKLVQIGGLDKLGFPLPVFAQNLINAVVNEQLPKLFAEHYTDLLKPFAELYDTVSDPQTSSLCERLSMLDGGAFISKRGCDLRDQVVEILPEYLGKNHQKLAEIVTANVLETVFKVEDTIKTKLTGNSVAPTEETHEQLEQLNTRYAWLKSWLDKQLMLAGTSQDPRIVNIWEFLRNTFDKLLAHSVQYVHAEEPVTADITGKVITRLLAIVGKYMEENGDRIQRRYSELNAANIDPASDKEFIDSFHPLCESVFKTLGLDHSDQLAIPTLIKPLLTKIILEQLPQWMAGEYRQCLAPRECIQEYKDQLKDLIPQNAATAVDQVEVLCGVIAPKVTAAMVQVLHQKIGEELKQAPAWLQDQHLKHLQDTYINEVVKSLLLQLLVHYLQGIRTDGSQAEEGLVTAGLAMLGATLEQHIAADAKALDEAMLEKDPDQRMKRLVQAFQPLSEDLFSLIGSKEGTHHSAVPFVLPFPEIFESIWADLKKQILPAFLAQLFLEKGKLPTILVESKEKTVTVTKTAYLPEACRVLGQWVSDFLPAYLYTDREHISEQVYQGVSEYLKSIGNPEGLSVQQYLEQNQATLKTLLSEEVFGVLGPGTPFAAQTQPFIGEYVKTLLMKGCSRITKKIAEAENPEDEQRKDFLVKLGIRLLEVVTKHFKTINLTTSEHKAVHVFDLTYEQHLQGFAGSVQPGLPKSKAALQAKQEIAEAMAVLSKERKRYPGLKKPEHKVKCLEKIKLAKDKLRKAKAVESKEREAFFKPFAASILELAGLTKAEDVPFPEPLKSKIWDLAQNQVLPEVLSSLFQLILEPANLNSMVIAGLETLNAAMDAIPDPDTVEEVHDDPIQRKLNTCCGELVLELVNLVPKSFVKAAFKLGPVQVLSAELVGNAVRRQLGENMTLQKYLDKAVLVGLPKLHPGLWEGEGEEAKFVGQSIVVGTKAGEIKFSSPLEIDEIEKAELEKMMRAALEAKRMKKLMVSTTRRVIGDAINSFFLAPVIKFYELWDKAVDKIPEDVREFFNYLGKCIVFRFLETIFTVIVEYAGAAYEYSGAKIASETLKKEIANFFWFFIELHFGRKADNVIKSMYLDIHENLLFNLSNELIESIKDPYRKTVIEPLLEAAMVHDRIEEEEKEKYLKRWNLPASAFRKDKS